MVKNGLRCDVIRMAVLGVITSVFACVPRIASAAEATGEGPALAPINITQDEIESGKFSLLELRRIGRQIFSTPFNKLDGYGDGPHDIAEDPTAFGGRPTLQGNGTFLRVNGMDAQSCAECHFALSTREIPMTFAIGGFAGSNSNAMFAPLDIDVDDSDDVGFAGYNGRFINPPFLFGVGGVELVGKEMTQELQNLKQEAIDNEDEVIELITKGVSFGTIVYTGGSLNFDGVEGIDDDLVVRPFGRKGDNSTTRAFDNGAFQFHLGMQTVEAVGADVDADNDGVVNEILIGELSAVVIFNTTLERPIKKGNSKLSRSGGSVFNAIGCAECHVPEFTTESPFLTYSFPENEASPYENVYYQADLTQKPTNFRLDEGGGIIVQLFSDLKRHDMGPGLAESFGSDLDSFFITAKLWGVADSPPYLHDGRALTLGEAISLHGGEAEGSRDAFLALSQKNKNELLGFLLTLRTPEQIGADLDAKPKGKN